MGKSTIPVIGGVVVVVACATFLATRRAPAPPAKPMARAVATTPAGSATALSAQLRAQHTIAVPSPIGGAIDAFFADLNQEVMEGQLLARVGAATVENARENAARELATARSRVAEMESQLVGIRLEASRARTEAERAQLELARLDKLFRRQATLFSEGATPKLVYQKAEKEFHDQEATYKAYQDLARQAENRVADLTAAIDNARKAALDKEQQAEEAEAALLASEVHAPAAGLIVVRRGEVGKAIAATERDDLFRIAVDLNLLEAAFLAPAGATVGQNVVLTFPDIGIPDITAPIAAIRNNEAVVPFVSAAPALKPGMTCGIRVPLK